MKIRAKPNILVMLGWNDPVVFGTIGRFAKEAGWHLELRPFFSEAIPVGWKGDGMIVSHGERKDVMRFIRKQAKCQPTVIFGGNNPGISAPLVIHDDYAAGKLAAEHLLQQGHRHFAWYAPFAGEVSSHRYKGFADTLKLAGQECLALNIPTQEWRQRKRLLAGHLRYFSLITFFNVLPPSSD
jgi:LacI family transcriptional regulator